MAGTGGSNLTGSLETSAQLQPPHVAHDRRGIECLLHGQRERERKRGRKKLLCLAALPREKKKQQRAYKTCSNSCQSDNCSFSRLLLSFCQDTDLPFTFGEVLLDLSTDRFMDILVQSCVSRDPAKSSRIRQLTGKLSCLIGAIVIHQLEIIPN